MVNVDARKQSFLNAVLGDSGALALAKAAERSTAFEQALVPRAILAWIQSATVYEGEIPGSAGTEISFEKTEAGFTGYVSVTNGQYRFENASAFHLGASVAVALGIDPAQPAEMRELDLERLGKSIDLLAKVRRVSNELAKKDKFCPGCTFKTDKHAKDCEKVELLEKSKEGGGAGLTAAPLAPTAPTPPTGTAPQQPTTTTLPSLPGSAQKPKAAAPIKPAKLPKATTKLTRSEAGHTCGACGQRQFGEDPFVFRGCMCFRALAAGVHVVDVSKSEIVLQMDSRIWAPEAVVTFLESIGRVRDDR